MESINLIAIKDQKIVVNEEAVQQLIKHDGPISVVSACGDYRTGKSFLLNMLFSLNCFDVSPTTQPCTKGISMSKYPIQISGKKIWIFDTQGFGSMQQQGKYDAKIFLLTILLSETLIYNSVGSLDEISISKMGLMCQQAIGISKLLSINQNESENESCVNSDTCLYWILRDFALSLINKDGDKISPDYYLEESLCGDSEERKVIRKLFNKKKCFPIVRPCISEQHLQCLKSINPNKLRPEFLSEVQNLKRCLVDNIQPKKAYGKPLTGRQFVELIKIYVQMINQPNFDINLTVTWESIQQHQRQLILQKMDQQFELIMRRNEKLMPFSAENLRKLRSQMKQKTDEHKSQIQNYQIREQVQKISHQQLSKLLEKNKKVTYQKCHKILHQTFSILCIKIQSSVNNHNNFCFQLSQQISKLKSNYYKHVKNYSDIQAVSEEYSAIVQNIMSWLNSKVISRLADQMKLRESKISSLEHQKLMAQCEVKQENKKLEQLKNRIGGMIATQQQLQEKEINYQLIIKRLERVNQNLRTQFQMLQFSQKQLKQLLQVRTRQFSERIASQQQAYRLLENKVQESKLEKNKSQTQLQLLRSQIEIVKKEYKKQIQAKKQGYLQMLTVERQNFQKLLEQKNQQINSMKKEIQDLQNKHTKIRDDLVGYATKIDKQYEGMLLQKQKYFKKEMDNLYCIINQSSSNQILLKAQTQKLYQEIDKKIQLIESKNVELNQQRKKMKELQGKVCVLEAELVEQQQKYESKLKIQGQISEKKAQKVRLLEAQLRQIRQKHRDQLQSLSDKLNEGMEKYANSSKQKLDLSKKQYEVQQQKVAQKLIEAAQRIENFVEKQKMMELQLEELQNVVTAKQNSCDDLKVINKQLEEKISQLNLQLNDLTQQLRVCQISQKNDKSLSSNRNYLRNQKSQDRGQKSKRSLSPVEKSNLTYRSKQVACNGQLKDMLPNDIRNQNVNPQMTLQKRSQNQKDATKTKLLMLENEQLKQQVDEIKKEVEKWKVESLKKINLHSLMKKMQSQEINQLEEEKENDKIRVADLQYKLGVERLRQVELNAQISQLHQVILGQTHQIIILQQNLEHLKSSLNEILQQKQNIRNDAEHCRANYEIKIKMMTNQWQQLNKKYNGLAKQVSIWRMKGSSTNRKEMGAQNEVSSGGYRGKIDELFKFLS